MTGFLQGEDPGDAEPEPVPIEPSGAQLTRRRDVERAMRPTANAILASFHREQRRQARAAQALRDRAAGQPVPHPMSPAD